MHIPVLINEVIKYLDPKPGENFIDCTAGYGGHSRIILEKVSPSGRLLAIELDSSQISNCKDRLAEFKDRALVINDSYANLQKIVIANNFNSVDGVLLDLGFSSGQVDISGRGFSFLKDEPLDMRYCATDEITASQILNNWPQEKIQNILQEYGEERFAKQIAKAVVENRKINRINRTTDLLKIINNTVTKRYGFSKINPATRTFQALRIEVNKELENLKIVLPQAISILKPGGKIAVISFHSLEDKIVKNYFKQESDKKIINILTKKPIEAQDQEISTNPRSRSAKMRVAIKI